MPSNHVFDIRMLGGEWGTEMTCREAGCEANAKGWWVVLDVTTEQGAGAAKWIKQSSGRRFWEFRGGEALEGAAKLAADGEITLTPEFAQMLAGVAPGMSVFGFPPGQTCFKQHLDREVKFHHVTRAGAYEHTRPQDFNEDFNLTADRLELLRKRG